MMRTKDSLWRIAASFLFGLDWQDRTRWGDVTVLTSADRVHYLGGGFGADGPHPR